MGLHGRRRTAYSPSPVCTLPQPSLQASPSQLIQHFFANRASHASLWLCSAHTHQNTGTKECTQGFTGMNQHTDIRGRSTAAAFVAQFVSTATMWQVPKKSNQFCSSLDSTYMAMMRAPCSPWQLEGIVRAGKH